MNTVALVFYLIALLLSMVAFVGAVATVWRHRHE